MKKTSWAFSLYLCVSLVFVSPLAAVELEQAAGGLNGKNKEEVVAAVAYIAKHADEVPPIVMFLASARAMALGDIETSGFLFYAAQIRAKFDLQRFPPVGEGGNSPGVAIGAIKYQVGAVVNPRVFRAPEIYSKILDRLDTLDAKTGDTYDPGWEYKPSAQYEEKGHTWEKELLKTIKSDYLMSARGLSRLLNTPEYFTAFKIVQDFNFGSADNREDTDNKSTYDEAINTMTRIETEMKIKGMFYKGEDAS